MNIDIGGNNLQPDAENVHNLFHHLIPAELCINS